MHVTEDKKKYLLNPEPQTPNPKPGILNLKSQISNPTSQNLYIILQQHVPQRRYQYRNSSCFVSPNQRCRRSFSRHTAAPDTNFSRQNHPSYTPSFQNVDPRLRPISEDFSDSLSSHGQYRLFFSDGNCEPSLDSTPCGKVKF